MVYKTDTFAFLLLIQFVLYYLGKNSVVLKIEKEGRLRMNPLVKESMQMSEIVEE
jgi:hypothetical protein